MLVSLSLKQIVYSQSKEIICMMLIYYAFRNQFTFQAFYSFYTNKFMSTLAAARADNFYVRKNFDPKNVPPKKSQLKEDKPFQVVEGERVGGGKVRYETPFHVRCEGCQNMVAKGVRFNAIKTWVGNFHSTKIYEFRMKCPQCVQKFVVRTDPQNCDYIYVSGAKRIFQTKDCTDESRIRDQAIQQKIREDPFYKLQNEIKDKELYGSMQVTIEKLYETNERGEQDFQMNRMLRKKIRSLKEEESAYLNEKREKNLLIPLLSLRQQDEEKAQEISFKNNKIKLIKKQQKPMSQREKLKQKMKKLNVSFQNQLKTQIKHCNKFVTNSLYRK